jgi:hypothetical protein
MESAMEFKQQQVLLRGASKAITSWICEHRLTFDADIVSLKDISESHSLLLTIGICNDALSVAQVILHRMAGRI